MSKNTRMAVAIACTLFAATGCKKELTTTHQDIQIGGIENSAITGAGSISPALLQKITEANARIAERFPNGLKPLSQQGPVHHSELQDLARRALAVEPTACDANTQVSLWLDQQLADWNTEVITFVLNMAMLDVPTYHALYFENSSANQVFGVSGEYTQVMQKTFKDHKRFWNIASNDIALVSLSGKMLGSKEAIKKVYSVVYGLGPDDAEYFASVVAQAVAGVPQYRKGNHPIFSFNAFALRGFSIPALGTIPNKIAMGDGIMQAYGELGYGDVAPQAIFSHEFGHHVQFQLNLFPPTTTPEGTRRTELMADAYSTYYLSHSRGAAMQWKRAQLFYDVFYNIGDCGFTNPGHHGTPLQRLHSSQWAYGVANAAQKQGHILTSQAFTALFEKQLPQLVD